MPPPPDPFASLPVADVLERVVAASRSGAVVVTAPPGSGKATCASSSTDPEPVPASGGTRWNGWPGPGRPTERTRPRKVGSAIGRLSRRLSISLSLRP